MSETEQTNHAVDYVGTTGELLPIVLLNILLTIITLGIYRFWAKTNLRKYFWNKVRFDSEPFEYTGTGKELFIGALIVFFIFILPLMIGINIVMIMLPMIAPFLILILYPLFIFLIGVAIYRAQVYRMSRTNWRRIRGAQIRKSKAYGWLTLKYAVLLVITFGLIAPYVICRMWNFMMNNKRMGSGILSSEVKSRPLFKIWLLTLLAFFAGSGGVAAMFYMAALSNNVGLFILIYILAIIFVAVIFTWFQAALLNHLINGVKFQDMAFNFHIGVSELLIFKLVNALILIFTLGLGASFVTQRWLRLMCEKISFTGQIDFALIAQSPETGPAFGEGLAEAFDIG